VSICLQKKPEARQLKETEKKKEALLCIMCHDYYLSLRKARRKNHQPVSSFSIIQFQHFSVALITFSLICLPVKRTHLTLARREKPTSSGNNSSLIREKFVVGINARSTH